MNYSPDETDSNVKLNIKKLGWRFKMKYEFPDAPVDRTSAKPTVIRLKPIPINPD